MDEFLDNSWCATLNRLHQEMMDEIAAYEALADDSKLTDADLKLIGEYYEAGHQPIKLS
jgi:hypothetical protein